MLSPQALQLIHAERVGNFISTASSDQLLSLARIYGGIRELEQVFVLAIAAAVARERLELSLRELTNTLDTATD